MHFFTFAGRRRSDFAYQIGGDERPPRFSARCRAGIRTRLVRSTVPVGGSHSPGSTWLLQLLDRLVHRLVVPGNLTVAAHRTVQAGDRASDRFFMDVQTDIEDSLSSFHGCLFSILV